MKMASGAERNAETALRLTKENQLQRGPFPGCDENDVCHDAVAEMLTDPGTTVKRAVNRVITRIRSRQYQRRKRGLPREVRLDADPSSRINVEKDVVQREAWGRLLQALKTLNPADYQIFEHRRAGWSHRAIGAKLGMSHTHVRTREKEIIAFLATKLDDFDVADFKT